MQDKLRRFITQRLRKPTENFLILLGLFFAACINYLQGDSGRFIFEIEILNYAALFFLCLVLFLLVFNSFFFNKIWLKVIGSLFFVILLLITILFTLSHFVDGMATILVRRFDQPGGRYVVSVYETKYYSFPDYGMGPLCICQVHIRQEKVFPGILRNRGTIYKDGCFPCDVSN